MRSAHLAGDALKQPQLHSARLLHNRSGPPSRPFQPSTITSCYAGQPMLGCRLMGSGSSVPAARLTNDDLTRLVDTNDEWIATRTGMHHRSCKWIPPPPPSPGPTPWLHVSCCTMPGHPRQTCRESDAGIRSRHVLSSGESLSQHASAAAQNALEMAGVMAADVDIVLLATSSPDDVFGSASQACRAA